MWNYRFASGIWKWFADRPGGVNSHFQVRRSRTQIVWTLRARCLGGRRSEVVAFSWKATSIGRFARTTDSNHDAPPAAIRASSSRAVPAQLRWPPQRPSIAGESPWVAPTGVARWRDRKRAAHPVPAPGQTSVEMPRSDSEPPSSRSIWDTGRSDGVAKAILKRCVRLIGMSSCPCACACFAKPPVERISGR
jgi:hypothetical protein